MNSTPDTEPLADHPSTRTHAPQHRRRLVLTGLTATLSAVLATTATAGLAQFAGVRFEIPEGGETIPLSGFAVVTGVFSIVGILIAAALLRWSARPADRFSWTAGALTALSLIPPLLSGASAVTTVALIMLHLVAAAVMIPSLTRCLRASTGAPIRAIPAL